MTATKTKQQNLSLEVAKLAAACFVVFIHAPFPEPLGTAVGCIARFAVPFFFAVSGYYSFGIGPEKIKKRIVHVLKLHLIAALLSVVMGCINRMAYIPDVLYYLRWEVIPDSNEIFRLVALQENPYGGHLWYLSSLLLCYLVLLAYRSFWGSGQQNGHLYRAGFALLAVFFALSTLGKMEGMEVPFMVYRNGWLMGIPMFTMGMFLREYRDRLMENFRLTDGKMLVLMGFGLALSLMQALNGYSAELPVGMMLTVPALILFLQKHPDLPVNSLWIRKLAARCGVLSTAVYLLHIAAIDVYDLFLKETALDLLGTKEDTLMPIVVLAITFVGAFLWERLDWLINRKKSPR